MSEPAQMIFAFAQRTRRMADQRVDPAGPKAQAGAWRTERRALRNEPIGFALR